HPHRQQRFAGVATTAQPQTALDVVRRVQVQLERAYLALLDGDAALDRRRRVSLGAVAAEVERDRTRWAHEQRVGATVGSRRVGQERARRTAGKKRLDRATCDRGYVRGRDEQRAWLPTRLQDRSPRPLERSVQTGETRRFD